MRVLRGAFRPLRRAAQLWILRARGASEGAGQEAEKGSRRQGHGRPGARSARLKDEHLSQLSVSVHERLYSALLLAVGYFLRGSLFSCGDVAARVPCGAAEAEAVARQTRRDRPEAQGGVGTKADTSHAHGRMHGTSGNACEQSEHFHSILGMPLKRFATNKTVRWCARQHFPVFFAGDFEVTKRWWTLLLISASG